MSPILTPEVVSDPIKEYIGGPFYKGRKREKHNQDLMVFSFVIVSTRSNIYRGIRMGLPSLFNDLLSVTHY